MADLQQIDWEGIAQQLSTFRNEITGGRTETGSRSIACAAVEVLLGSDRLASAVDHYVEGRPGSELARSVLWLLHPWGAMQRCRQLFDSSTDLRVRRSAVELLRVVADARVIPWIPDFLADPDAEIQTWGILILDQLACGRLVEQENCKLVLEQARQHPNPQVRDALQQIETQLTGERDDPTG